MYNILISTLSQVKSIHLFYVFMWACFTHIYITYNSYNYKTQIFRVTHLPILSFIAYFPAIMINIINCVLLSHLSYLLTPRLQRKGEKKQQQSGHRIIYAKQGLSVGVTFGFVLFYFCLVRYNTCRVEFNAKCLTISNSISLIVFPYCITHRVNQVKKTL